MRDIKWVSEFFRKVFETDSDDYQSTFSSFLQQIFTNFRADLDVRFVHFSSCYFIFSQGMEDVKKNLKDGNIDAANELVRAGKELSRSYLVGRLIRKKESKGNSPTRASDQYLANLTEKIRDELEQEMEEKMDRNVREFRDNIKVMMSKLAEKNPELQIDIEELSKLQPPSEQPPSDATGTSK
ncbi:uncharacterized protein LOC141676560 [Apium graveolens]|uniref:uncharacterized protein LOC141676560 n=1 Tax=Apium graveolens TaxID=4045 RepID=UPI003D7B566B